MILYIKRKINISEKKLSLLANIIIYPRLELRCLLIRK